MKKLLFLLFCALSLAAGAQSYYVVKSMDTAACKLRFYNADTTKISEMDCEELVFWEAPNGNIVVRSGDIQVTVSNQLISPTLANTPAYLLGVQERCKLETASDLLFQDSSEICDYTVINSLNTPPGGPATGASYVVGTSPTGAWVGHANEIAEWDGAAWQYTVPAQGCYYYNQTNGYTFQYRSGVWVRTSRIVLLNDGQSLSSGVRWGTNNQRSASLETNNVIRWRVDSIGVEHAYYTPTGSTGDTLVVVQNTNGKRSKVPKSTFLLGLGSTTKAANGLTMSGDTVLLGGVLTGNVYINGNTHKKDFTVYADTLIQRSERAMDMATYDGAFNITNYGTGADATINIQGADSGYVTVYGSDNGYTTLYGGDNGYLTLYSGDNGATELRNGSSGGTYIYGDQDGLFLKSVDTVTNNVFALTTSDISTGLTKWQRISSGGSQTPWTSDINAAGYTLNGNSTSGGNLTLASTSHATKGKIFLGANSAYNEVTNSFGIGTTSPTAYLHLAAGTATANTSPIKFTAGTVNATTEALTIEAVTSNFTFSPSANQRFYFGHGANSTNFNLGITTGTSWNYSGTVLATAFGYGITGLNNYSSAFGSSINFNGGDYNTGFGVAIATSGSGNVMGGYNVGQNTNSGSYNIAFGYGALSRSSGSYNISLGYNALGNATAVLASGAGNIAIGYRSMGDAAMTTGAYNIAIGHNTEYNNITTGSKNIVIGYSIKSQSATANGQLSIGNLIFGTGLGDSTGTSTEIGKVGIMVPAPTLDFEVKGRMGSQMGANVASANDLILLSGNVFHITGATQINAITTTNWIAGAQVILIFDSTPTVKNNTAGGGSTAVILLAGGADFSATANDVLKLVYDGTSWFEVSRSVN